MSILSARHIVNGLLVKEYKRNELTAQLYSSLSGELYCPTPNCNARVIYKSGNKACIRTWSNDDHIEGCVHEFERVRGRVGVDTTRFINVELSAERKKRALREALAEFKMTEEEKELRSKKRAERKNNPTTIEKRSQPSSNLVLINGDAVAGEGTIGVRGPNLPKRTPSMLKENDRGKPRLVMGLIEDVIISGTSAEIIVVNDKTEVHVKFEEVFFVNSPNYSGLFHHIKRYISEEIEIVFTGIGEVRVSHSGDFFELSVFYGEDFEMNGITLDILARNYAIGA